MTTDLPARHSIVTMLRRYGSTPRQICASCASFTTLTTWAGFDRTTFHACTLADPAAWLPTWPACGRWQAR